MSKELKGLRFSLICLILVLCLLCVCGFANACYTVSRSPYSLQSRTVQRQTEAAQVTRATLHATLRVCGTRRPQKRILGECWKATEEQRNHPIVNLNGLRPHAAGAHSNGSSLVICCLDGSFGLDLFWELLRRSWAAVGGSQLALGSSLGCSWSLLGRSWGLLGRLVRSGGFLDFPA